MGVTNGGSSGAQAIRKDILTRLVMVEGHLKGIRKMVECALQTFEGAILDGHLNSFVVTGFREGRDLDSGGDGCALPFLSRPSLSDDRAVAMAMSNVGVLTNALLLGGFRRSHNADEILDSSWLAHIGDHA